MTQNPTFTLQESCSNFLQNV